MNGTKSMKSKKKALKRAVPVNYWRLITPVIVVIVVGSIGVYVVVASHAASLTPTFNIQAAETMAKSYDQSPTKVGLSLYDASDKTALVNYNSTTETHGASITKAMILVAYLKQVGTAKLSSKATSELTSMIEISDNTSADWVYSQIKDGPAAIEAVAKVTDMSGFEFNASDPVYVLGQSKVTAKGFAEFFANITNDFPATHKTFALYLLSHIATLDQNGLLKSKLPGTVYSKEGWKPENPGYEGAPYIVEQAAQFSEDGQTYGVAVTVGGTATETSGETIIQNVVSTLVH